MSMDRSRGQRPLDDRELLDRLLGPAEPELSCEECFAQLDRYVEIELAGGDAAAEVPRMKPHLAGCAACRDDYESLRDLVAGTAADSPPEPA